MENLKYFEILKMNAELEDKMKSKKVYSHGLEKSYGNFTIKFD